MMSLLAGGLSAALSLGQGLFARNDAKKAAKLARIESERARDEAAYFQERNEEAVAGANTRNNARVKAANKESARLGQLYINRPDVDFAKMVKHAEAAGFNPLTVIRNGGIAAYSKSNDLAGFSMMAPQHLFQESAFQWSALPQVQHASVPSFGTVAMGALQDGFNSYATEARVQQQQEFQRSMLDASLKGVAAAKKAGSKTAGTFGYVPSVTSSGSSTRSAGAQLGVYQGGVTEPTPGDTTVTNPWPNWWVEPKAKDAEASEQRYGEAISEIQGVSNWWDDTWFNVTGLNKAQRFERTKGWANSVGQMLKLQKSPTFSWVPSISFK